jgi:hypothetical protein
VPEVGKEVYNAGAWKSFNGDRFAKAFKVFASFGVEGMEKKCWGNNVNDTATIDFRIANTFSVTGSHRFCPSPGRWLTIHPQGFPGVWIDGRNGPAIASDGVDNAVDIAWC